MTAEGKDRRKKTTGGSSPDFGAVRMLRFFSFWMVLFVFPGVLYQGLEKNALPLMIWEMGCYGGLILAAMGLFLRFELSRRLAVFFLFLTTGFNLYVVCFLIGPGYSASLEWLSIHYQVDEKWLRQVAPPLLGLYILWPLVMAFSLTHPRIRAACQRRRDLAPESDAALFSRNSAGLHE